MPTNNAVAADQPRPPMWGYGRHACLGRELAKLEILVFLRTFLAMFDYDVVEGQVCSVGLLASTIHEPVRRTFML